MTTSVVTSTSRNFVARTVDTDKDLVGCAVSLQVLGLKFRRGHEMHVQYPRSLDGIARSREFEKGESMNEDIVFLAPPFFSYFCPIATVRGGGAG